MKCIEFVLIMSFWPFMFTSQQEKYTKMDINIDEENITASVRTEEKLCIINKLFNKPKCPGAFLISYIY